MAERRASKRQDGRAHLGIRDDLDAKDIGESGSAVVAEGAENEVLALLVEDEDAGQHGRDEEGSFALGEFMGGEMGGLETAKWEFGLMGW